MKEYANRDALIAEIKKTAALFIKEYEDIKEADKDLRMVENERTPYENLAYQLGWMALIQSWEQGERDGENVQMPAPGIKWNQMGALHARFYADYESHSLEELKAMFCSNVDAICQWLATINDVELFQPGGRKWAQSSPSNWPVWKWVHINTVAPFKSFRAKVRKWKTQRASQ